MSYKLSGRSRENLQGVHPTLVAVVERAIQLTVGDFMVYDGVRSVEEQADAVRRGASTTMESRHLTGHAVDLVPFDSGKVSWKWSLIFPIAAAMREAARELKTPLVWGGAWDQNLSETTDPPEQLIHDYSARRKAAGKRVFLDGPHFELPRNLYP
jgi:peptidoglycan L-alanyl-D-glutamate endopeptidase CwlK